MVLPIRFPSWLFAHLVIALALAAPVPASADAETAPSPIIAMDHASWTAASGAPAGVKGIMQTPDGWLWIGASSGLFRFDGVRFQGAQGALAPLSANINEIGVLNDGRLWVTYKFGGASLLQDGAMRHFPAGQGGMPGGTSHRMGQDSAGRVWLGTSSGTRMLGADGNWHVPDASFGVPAGDAGAMLLDRRQTFWVRSRDGVYALRRGSTRFERTLAVSGSGVLAEHPDGSIWASGMMTPGLQLVEGPAGSDPGAWATDDRINNFRFDRSGTMWLPGRSGVSRIGPAGSSLRQLTGRANGLSGQYGFTVFADREDNLWVGTESGIDRFRAYRLTPLALPPYIAGARPLAAHPRAGVWVDRSFLAGPDAAPGQIAPPSSDADLTTALYAAPDGVLWSGGIGGLWRIADGRRSAVPLPPDVPDPMRTAIFSLVGGADGALWVSLGRRGLYTLQGGRWLANGGAPGLAGLAPTAMARDAGGRIWFGSTDDRVAILERGVVRHLGRTEGLRMGTVLSILPVAGGAWIGGENGLAWYDGQRFTHLTGRGGDQFTGITGLVFARDGTLWLNGGAGISAIGPEQLARAAREPGYQPQFTRLDYRDGLPGTASGITPLPSAVRSSDGALWFSTTGGTVAFDPLALTRNTRVPPVVITALRADGQDNPVRAGVRLPPHTGTLEIGFSALSYRAPERMRFRYRLDGIDTDWQESEQRRTAHYTNLPPGRYRFAVIASNDDGLWNREGATLSFEVAPSLTQTLAFRLACALLIVAGLWLLHRMRLRHVARRVTARMNERLAERERIARELHDTLLQSVQGLILKMGASLQRLRDDERAPIEAALNQADEVLAEGRDRVAGLRGANPAHDDLAQAITAFGAPIAHEGAVHFEVRVDGDAVALAQSVGDEVFAVVREALRNAFAHAHAAAVTVTLDYRAAELVVSVADDGRGIAPDVLARGARPGHWGIPGMRERAAGIGTLELRSLTGGGTTWCLRVPLARLSLYGWLRSRVRGWRS